MMIDKIDPWQSASHTIYRVSRLLRFRAAAYFAAQGVDVSPEQWGVLLKLARDGESTVKDMADPVMGDYPNLSRLVQALVTRGLVRRTPDKSDRRVNLVSLTGEGRALIDEILPGLTEEKGLYFEGLDERDVAELKRILGVLEANLEPGQRRS